MASNHYVTLGVATTATDEDIKRAYRRLAAALHPDRNPGDGHAEQRFRQVTEAYHVLADPARRRAYDDEQRQPPPSQRWNAQVDGWPFTTGRKAKADGRKSRSLQVDAELALTFVDAFLGGEHEVRVPSATGATRSVRVRVPAGARDGGRIRLRGQGHVGRAGAGDLVVTLRVSPHPYFHRDGDDLRLELPITPLEAITGATIGVPTPDGVVKVRVPAGAHGGAKLRLRGRGVPRRDATRGDLVMSLSIAFPTDPAHRAMAEAVDAHLVGIRSALRW